jgi:archaellum biogenesis protein FlaJ (TadC family)
MEAGADCCSVPADPLRSQSKWEIKMTLRIISWAIAAIGLVLLVVSLTADLTGLGDDEGAFDVGLQQGAGIGLGLVLIVVGLVLVRRNQTKEM